MRLHSNNHASCVGVGNVQGHETTAGSLLRWRPQRRQSGGQKGVVVKVSDAVKPATYAAHKEAPSSAGVGRVTMKETCDGGGDRLVLWAVTHVCLAADWTAPPANQHRRQTRMQVPLTTMMPTSPLPKHLATWWAR